MRDLDELLDPVVSRRASDAARTPDFAAVQRWGVQRRRRARVAAVGAVVAVVATASAVAVEVPSDRSDTAPAGVIEYEGPDGELARAIESGEAKLHDVYLGRNDSLLTVWRQRVSEPTRSDPGLRYGFTLNADGSARWSPARFDGVLVSELRAGSYLVQDGAHGVGDVARAVYVADVDGIRRLDVAETSADFSIRYDGFAKLSVDRRASSQVYAVDLETLTAWPVAEETDGAFLDIGTIGPTDDGGFWLVGEDRMTYLDGDGEQTRYRIAGMRDPSIHRLDAEVTRDGRPVSVWSDFSPGGLHDPHQLKVSTVRDGEVVTNHLGDVNYSELGSAALLPDGRLLVYAGETLLRTTDPRWRSVKDLGPVEWLPSSFYTLHEAAGEVCLAPIGVMGQQDRETRCSTDGQSWEPVDLTP